MSEGVLVLSLSSAEGPTLGARIVVLHERGDVVLRNSTRDEFVGYYPGEGQWALHQRKERKFIRGAAAVVQYVQEHWLAEHEIRDTDRAWMHVEERYFETEREAATAQAQAHQMGTVEAQMALLNDLAREPKPEPTTIASEAHALVTGPKAEAYGTWESNMTRAADILNTVYGIELAPTEIIKVMLAVKLSRDFHKPQRDNPVDIAGYYSGLAELESRYKK